MGHNLHMPVLEELEAEEAQWYWEMGNSPESNPGEDWFWSEEEIQRQRQVAACELTEDVLLGD